MRMLKLYPEGWQCRGGFLSYSCISEVLLTSSSFAVFAFRGVSCQVVAAWLREHNWWWEFVGRQVQVLGNWLSQSCY